MSDEAPLYIPDPYKIDPDKDGLSGETVKRITKDEIVKTVKEVKGSGKDIVFVIYGLILKYGGNLDKLEPILEKRKFPPWVIWLIIGVSKVINWRAKRLKQ